jgi:hypothetical protein
MLSLSFPFLFHITEQQNQVPFGTNFSISSYISSGFCDCPLRSLKITSLEMFVCIPGGSFPYTIPKNNTEKQKNKQKEREMRKPT